MIQVPGEITRLLQRLNDGDRESVNRLLPIVYEELRTLAAARLRNEREHHTLQPTALVHEAWLRLCSNSKPGWTDRKHFFRAASRVMRYVLVDHARERSRQKRGGGVQNVRLDEQLIAYEDRAMDLVVLDDTLEKLAQFAPRQADLIELRFFGGLTVDEAAETLGISIRTAHADWRLARAWLHKEMAAD